MNQEAVMSRSFLASFRATGITMMICGGVNVIVAIRFIDLISSNSSSQPVIVDGFWSGLPLLMSGAYMMYTSGKRTTKALASSVVPCAIAFTTSLIQAIKSGMTASIYRERLGKILAMDCDPENKACNLAQDLNLCVVAMLISSSIGAGACLFGAVFGSMCLRTTTQETIPPAVNGVVLAQPSTQVITSYQITTPMQQPANYGPPMYAAQPNHPLIETTRDDAMLTP